MIDKTWVGDLRRAALGLFWTGNSLLITSATLDALNDHRTSAFAMIAMTLWGLTFAVLVYCEYLVYSAPKIAQPESSNNKGT